MYWVKIINTKTVAWPRIPKLHYSYVKPLIFRATYTLPLNLKSADEITRTLKNAPVQNFFERENMFSLQTRTS